MKKVMQSMKESKKHPLTAKEEVDDQTGRSAKRGGECEGRESDDDSEGMGQSKESEVQTTERSDERKSGNYGYNGLLMQTSTLLIFFYLSNLHLEPILSTKARYF